ncbi:MAG: hypothetical protein HC888_16005 [Candidatus Competibacteraceae bacterium]|nr:hypothetical protein [Candidatus Competibacteraceae bacterium]
MSLLNANFALKMLDVICGGNARSPQIVPGVGGDLQVEWHTVRGDIELHVVAPNHVDCWRRLIDADPEEIELTLTNEFSVVAAWVREITEQPRAVETAAA